MEAAGALVGEAVDGKAQAEAVRAAAISKQADLGSLGSAVCDLVLVADPPMDEQGLVDFAAELPPEAKSQIWLYVGRGDYVVSIVLRQSDDEDLAEALERMHRDAGAGMRENLEVVKASLEEAPPLVADEDGSDVVIGYVDENGNELPIGSEPPAEVAEEVDPLREVMLRDLATKEETLRAFEAGEYYIYYIRFEIPGGPERRDIGASIEASTASRQDLGVFVAPKGLDLLRVPLSIPTGEVG